MGFRVYIGLRLLSWQEVVHRDRCQEMREEAPLGLGVYMVSVLDILGLRVSALGLSVLCDVGLKGLQGFGLGAFPDLKPLT